MPILWTKTPIEAGVKTDNRLIYKQVGNKLFRSASCEHSLERISFSPQKKDSQPAILFYFYIEFCNSDPDLLSALLIPFLLR